MIRRRHPVPGLKPAGRVEHGPYKLSPARRHLNQEPLREQPMEALLQDFRFALRSLGRSRLFSAIAVGTLALSVGGVTTVFSVVHAALLRPLPFADSHRLMMLYITARAPGGRVYRHRWSFPRYRLLRRWQSGFVDLATFGP